MIASRRMSSLYTQIDAAGGLYSKAGLAKRWGVTQTMVGKYARRADFPTAIRVNDGEAARECWLSAEADAWFNARRATK